MSITILYKRHLCVRPGTYQPTLLLQQQNVMFTLQILYERKNNIMGKFILQYSYNLLQYILCLINVHAVLLCFVSKKPEKPHGNLFIWLLYYTVKFN